MPHHTNITLRAVSMLADHAIATSAPISAERNICAAAFDATGANVQLGPALDNLARNDAADASDYLISAALDMLNVNPSCGVLLLQYDAPTIISAFYIADASLSYIDSDNTTRH